MNKFTLYLEELLSTKIQSYQTVSGGDINQAFRLEANRGQYFLKSNQSPIALQMFETEANGLQALGQHLRTPQIIKVGQFENTSFLILEWIESGHKSKSFWEEFGIALAQMHRIEQAHFGWQEDNFIGTLPQKNKQQQDWTTFYIQERLQPQVKMAFDKGLFHQSDTAAFEQLYAKLDSICPKESPALIHGDLWSGNFMCDKNSNPVLIDPSVAYAHREMDLAMTRLFGGFATEFYQAYQVTYPLEKGFEERIEIYQLYYLLVHVNLFGGSYVQSVQSTLKRFV